MKQALCQGRRLTHLTSIPLEARKTIERLSGTGNMITTIHEDDLAGYHADRVEMDLTAQTRASCVQIASSLRHKLTQEYQNIEIKGLCEALPNKRITPKTTTSTKPTTTTPSVRYIPIPFPVKPENEDNDEQIADEMLTTTVNYDDDDEGGDDTDEYMIEDSDEENVDKTESACLLLRFARKVFIKPKQIRVLRE